MDPRPGFAPKSIAPAAAAWPCLGTVPALVIFPAPWPASGFLAPVAAIDIYRLAYERALAGTRPTLYDLARHVCEN